MTFSDKKQALLNLLSKQQLPINLPIILQKLGPEFKERSVRRWLGEMEHDGLITKTGQKRGTKYQIITKTSSTLQLTQPPSCFSPASEQALAQIKRPLNQRVPISYLTQWLDAYKPNSTYYFSKEQRSHLHQAGFRMPIDAPAGTYAHQIYNRLLIDLSYNSSRLEGNTYSLIDTERLILSGKGATGKLDNEKIMILNHKEAIRYLVENSFRLNVDTKTILTLHYLLSDGLLEPDYCGRIRDHGVHITQSTYFPYDNPKKIEMQLNKIAKKASKIKDPFEQSIFLLIHLSYIQAFSDVNKRTARLCANIPLISKNYVPLSFNDVEREDYSAATIAIYELQNTQPMVDLYLFSYLRTCLAYDTALKAMGFDEIRVRYRKERRNILRSIIDQKLIGSDVINFIQTYSQKNVTVQDQDEFAIKVVEDLGLIDDSRIAGLGISSEQMQEWKKAYQEGKSSKS